MKAKISWVCIKIGKVLEYPLRWVGFDFIKSERNFDLIGRVFALNLLVVVLTAFVYARFAEHSWPDWLKHSYWHLVGIGYGIFGILIGISVFLTVRRVAARNPDEFVTLFNTVLQEAKSGDDLFFLAPSFMIEREKYSDRYKEYRRLIQDKLTEGVKIEFAVLNIITSQLTNFVNLTPENQREWLNDLHSGGPLKRFHLSFPKVRNNSIANFGELAAFYASLVNNGCKFRWLNDNYDKYSKTIIVANRTNLEFFAGNYFRIHQGLSNETLAISVNEMEVKEEMAAVINDLLGEFEVKAEGAVGGVAEFPAAKNEPPEIATPQINVGGLPTKGREVTEKILVTTEKEKAVSRKTSLPQSKRSGKKQNKS